MRWRRRRAESSGGTAWTCYTPWFAQRLSVVRLDDFPHLALRLGQDPMQEVHGHCSRGHRASNLGFFSHKDEVLADGDNGHLPVEFQKGASFAGTMLMEYLEPQCDCVPPQGVHDQV